MLARAVGAGHPRYLGARVAHARDLGELLTRAAPEPAPDRLALIDDAAARAAARPQGAIVHHLYPRVPQPTTDLQIKIAAASHELRRRGHPENRP